MASDLIDPRTLLDQLGYHQCFVCGRDNPIGLKLEFTWAEDGVSAEFVPRPEHQGWWNQMHGGLVATILDEVMGWATFCRNVYTVTAKMELKLHKPVPIGQKVVATGQLLKGENRIFETRGELRSEDGTLLAEASGLYIRVPEKKRQEVEAYFTQTEEVEKEKAMKKEAAPPAKLAEDRDFEARLEEKMAKITRKRRTKD